MAILQRLFLLFCVRLIGVTHTPNYINISPAFLIFLLSLSKQSWHVSFSWVWMTLTRFVWRIQTHCWSRAPHCSTCGPLSRARGQRVSKSKFAVDICHFTSLKATLLWFLETHPSSSFFHACRWLLFFTAVESLYTALKSIDRMDIINMLEGQPPQPVRQGSRDVNRRRHSERDHLSPGMTNGKRPPQIPWPGLISVPFPWSPATFPMHLFPQTPQKMKSSLFPSKWLCCPNVLLI